MNINLLMIGTFLCSSCALLLPRGPSEKEIAWKKIEASEAYKKEKAIYNERIAGRKMCYETGLDEFLKKYAKKPSKECMYLHSGYSVVRDAATSGITQNFNQLKVLNSSKKGYILSSPNYGSSRVIFLYKTNDLELVDDSFLDDKQSWALYDYVGIYSYPTLSGVSTVYAFKKTPKKFIDGLSKGLKYYSSSRDYFIKNSLWDWLPNPSDLKDK